jgi:hypothetical protein
MFLRRYSKEELVAFIKQRPPVNPADKTHLMNMVDEGGYTISNPHVWVDAGGWNYCNRCCMAQSAPYLTAECRGY